jgi:WD40 repeat protein
VAAAGLDATGLNQAVSCDDGKHIFLWTIQANGNVKGKKFKKDHDRKMTYVALAGTKVLASSYDGLVTVRDLNNPNVDPLYTFSGHMPATPVPCPPEVWVVTGTQDGSLALSGANNGDVILWQTADGKILKSFNDSDVNVPKERVAALALLPLVDGKVTQFLSGHEDGKMLWVNFGDPVPANWTKRAFSHGNRNLPVNTVAATSDGSTAISAGFDRTARIWDLTTPFVPGNPEIAKAVIDHDDIVWRVAISPDNSKFATSSNNGQVRMFKIDGTEINLVPPLAEPGGVMGVAFLTNDQIVYTTGTADGNKDIKVWP